MTRGKLGPLILEGHSHLPKPPQNYFQPQIVPFFRMNLPTTNSSLLPMHHITLQSPILHSKKPTLTFSCTPKSCSEKGKQRRKVKTVHCNLKQTNIFCFWHNVNPYPLLTTKNRFKPPSKCQLSFETLFTTAGGVNICRENAFTIWACRKSQKLPTGNCFSITDT